MGILLQAQSNGEYVEYKTGTPTQDHFFVRGTYSDQGESRQYDNVISFKDGSPQLVWIHLNDDEIYENDDIQSLTPQAYDDYGHLYNEITYNSFQFDIYMPQGFRIVVIDRDTGAFIDLGGCGDNQWYINYRRGDRLPNTSTLSWARKNVTKIIDGVTYEVYTFTCFNERAFGTHFSSKTPSLYMNNGALKKDATLFGIYVQNNNQDQVEGRIEGDMILGNTLLTLRETDEIFFFGTGGHDVENRYMQYNRVRLYGSKGIDEDIIGPTLGSNYFSMLDIRVHSGDTITIPVSLTNQDEITAFQTDVYLPEGFEMVKEDGEYYVELSSRKTKNHVISANKTEDGAVRILCYTPSIRPFTGNDGELFYIKVRVPEGIDGVYPIWLRNSYLTSMEEEEIAINDASCGLTVYSYIKGDANNSGTVTVTDIVVTAKYILNYNPSPFVFVAADMNEDGNITVTDIVKIARIILGDELSIPKQMRAPAVSMDDIMRSDAVTFASTADTRTVNIELENTLDYTAFQFDISLPKGVTASNFRLSGRASSHNLDVNTLDNGDLRVICYSPAIKSITGNEGTLLSFDVTATGPVTSNIDVDGIELVTTGSQTVNMDAFSIAVNAPTAVNELITGKSIARVDYYNLSGQQISRPECGINIVVTTYTDGTRATNKLIMK